MADESSNNINVSSLDESVINLNDDLPMESSEHSFSSIDQPSSASTHQRLSHSHRRTGSLTSYRRSIDNESVVLLGTFSMPMIKRRFIHHWDQIQYMN